MAAPTPDQPAALRFRRDCSQLFLIYTGMAGAMMVHPLKFIAATGIMDRNLAVIRDLQQCCYQRGVSPDLPNIRAFLDWQRTLVQSFSHVRDVYCLGSSGGAYAALLAGHFLKAKQVWAFAPPVPVQAGDKVTYVDPQFHDISQVLAADNGVSRYEVYYNEAQEIDRVAAARLQGLPGVTLHPQGGQGHSVIVHLANTNQLKTMLPSFVGC